MNLQLANFQKGGSKIIIAVVVIVLTIAILAVVYFFSQDRLISLVENSEVIPGSESEDNVAEEIFLPGEVGEVIVENEVTGKNESLTTAELPQAIFSTTGVIVEIKKDRLIIKGSGTSFADGVSRDLICLFNEETLVFDESKIKYAVEQGLVYLKPGDMVMIESAENIRGKTEFILKTISIMTSSSS